MVRILITGGGGFIGSHLAEFFVKKGCETIILDDFTNANLNNIRGLLRFKNFMLVKEDVRNFDLLKEISKDVNAIFHLAAQIHVDKSVIYPTLTFEVNTIGTLNVLEAARQNRVDKVVYASSSEVYGTAKYVPMDEEHPLNPSSPYAASKAAADRLCFSYYNTYGLNVVIVRNFNTFGPRQKNMGYASAIPMFIRRVLQTKPPIIFGDGKQTRDYLYVKDAIEAYNLVYDNFEDVVGEAINFGTGKEIEIKALAEKIIKLCEVDNLVPIHTDPRPGEVRRLCADISKARKKLGFNPKWNLDEAVKEYIGHMKAGYDEELVG